jgi:hypothetical protein
MDITASHNLDADNAKGAKLPLLNHLTLAFLNKKAISIYIQTNK